MAKKIGIISDTHGLLRPEILEILKTCDCILHAGDVTRPELIDELRCLASIYVVRGNNDGEWAAGIAKTLHFRIEGVEFFMTHNKKDVAWQHAGRDFWSYPQLFRKNDRWQTMAESGKLRKKPFRAGHLNGSYDSRKWHISGR